MESIRVRSHVVGAPGARRLLGVAVGSAPQVGAAPGPVVPGVVDAAPFTARHVLGEVVASRT